MVGAKRSDKEPVRSRAAVEVSDIIVTCVDGIPAGGDEFGADSRGLNV